MEDHDVNLRQSRAELKLKIRRRGIYLLPNLITLAALFFGFSAVLQSVNMHFDAACVSVFIAMVLDSLDGRVARMTKTQSAFGAELDSLSDMVSFGVAPAVLMYEWAINEIAYRQLGMVAAFVYCACAALRLARFNVQINVVDKRFFMGLPSPAAAALVAGFVWVCNDAGRDGSEMRWWALALTFFAGLSMVTTARFYSFKTVNLKRSVPFAMLSGAMLVYAAVSLDPPVVLFSAFFLYLLSGYVYTAINFKKFFGCNAQTSSGNDTADSQQADKDSH